MSKSTLSEFIAKIRSEGLLLGSHFYVIMTPPFYTENNGGEIMMMCDSINVPGKTIATQDIRMYGETREIPYMPIYPTLEASFIVDRRLRVKQFFEDWMNSVINNNTRELAYRNFYSTDIEIIVTDKNSVPVHKIKAYDVFPKNMTDMQLDYASKEVLRLRVTFSMRYWENMNIGEDGVDNPNNRMGTISPTIQSLRNPSEIFREQGILESLGANTSIGFGNISTSGNFITDIARYSKSFSADAFRSTNSSYALIQSSPNTSTQYKQFGETLRGLGKVSGDLGTALNGIGEGIRNITGPIAALSDATTSVANVLGSVNTAANALGLGTPFSGAIAAMTDVSGKIAVISNVGGIPGSLSTVGATMGAVGGAFESVTRSVENIPGTTTKIKESLSQIGSIFKRDGGNIQEASSTLQSGINDGRY
jgi:hypothetical protein